METVTKCCPTRTRKIVPENDVVTTSTEYDYNPANQLESWTESNGAGGTLRSALIGFDERGNRDTQTVTLPGGVEKTTQYDWDFQNRLVGVTDPQGGAHAYAYDYRTRRIARSEPAGSTAVSWSGGLSLAEYPVSGLQSAIADPQSPIVEYRRGPDMGGGIGGLLHSLRDGAPKYNLGNGRGDVVAQSDQSGALTWTASYGAFGMRPVETGSNADRQRANTKEEDPTGLLWEHFRYRDLETGVWLSRDPAGFVDGPNLYAYVNQNPWSKFDPLGLEGAALRFSQYQESRLTGQTMHSIQQRDGNAAVEGSLKGLGVGAALVGTKGAGGLIRAGLEYVAEQAGIPTLNPKDLKDLPKNIKAGLKKAKDLLKKDKGSNSPTGPTAKDVSEKVTPEVTPGLTDADKARIQRFADDNGVEVNVVGSRADTDPNYNYNNSDYDYIVGPEGGNSKLRQKARRDLPRGNSGGEIHPTKGETGIDVFNEPVDPDKGPSIKFEPKEKE